MKYSLIEIRPKQDSWQVSLDDTDNRDRVSQKSYVPHSLEFFRFPRNWGGEKGFEVLKNHLIQKHQYEIARLEKSLSALKKLKCPEWIQRMDSKKGLD